MNHCRTLFHAVLVLVAIHGCLAADILKSRGFAGFAYRDITEADTDSLGLADMNGVVVTQVVPNTPAEHAGLKTGDIIKKYENSAIWDGSDLVTVTRSYYAGDKIKITVLRSGKERSVNLVLRAFPREKSNEVQIEYTSFRTDGIMLRAVMASPLHSDKKKLPGLLIISALGSPRLISNPGYDMMRSIAHEVAKNGFRVMRFELRGAGDSQGDDYRNSDFSTEVNDNLAALDYIVNREDVDPNRVFVMGHSTGGMIAGILASERSTAGLVTSCTMGRTYYERLTGTLRLQGELGGDSPSEIDQTIKDYLELTTAIGRGDDLGLIFERRPNLSRFVNRQGRIMDDRSVEYWRQQLNLDLPEIYSQVDEPVLIIYAGSDFLTQLACHEQIREVLLTSGNPDVTLSVVPNLDHTYSYAGDKKESYENYKTRSFRENPEAKKQIVEWLLARKGT